MDLAKSPKHYTTGGIEVVDIIRAKAPPEYFKGWCYCNVLKYSLRAPYKKDFELDIRKLIMNANWLADTFKPAFPPELRVSSKKASRKSKPKNKKKKSP